MVLYIRYCQVHLCLSWLPLPCKVLWFQHFHSQFPQQCTASVPNIHYYINIQNFGTPNGLCSSITESHHITAVKKQWRRSYIRKTWNRLIMLNELKKKLLSVFVLKVLQMCLNVILSTFKTKTDSYFFKSSLSTIKQFHIFLMYMGHLVMLNSLVTPKCTHDNFHMLFFPTSKSTSSYLSLLPSPNHTVLSFGPMDTLLTLEIGRASCRERVFNWV